MTRSWLDAAFAASMAAYRGRQLRAPLELVTTPAHKRLLEMVARGRRRVRLCAVSPDFAQMADDIAAARWRQ